MILSMWTWQCPWQAPTAGELFMEAWLPFVFGMAVGVVGMVWAWGRKRTRSKQNPWNDIVAGNS